jgi:DNA uptake protein ComE-like DNA-binding protein
MKRFGKYAAALPILFVLNLSSSYKALAAQAAAIVPVGILRPAADAQGHLIQSAAPDGRLYPVFRPAEDSAFIERVRKVMETSFAQQVLRLDRYVRDRMLGDPIEGGRERWKEPMYLLLSGEEGGFARFGFWLEDPHAGKRLVSAGYVDLVVDEEDIKDGNLEEIFSHELGHLILKSLLGEINSGPSRKMHQSMTVTDFPTAFDEGYAEHFQPLVRDATSNPYLRELGKGATSTDLNLLWLSRLDQQLRTDGVKRNLFVHRKALPALALQLDPDRYQLFLDGETSGDFISDELKNAQEMMACEGVIATLFYRLVNDDTLRNQYRQAGFYQQFLAPGFPIAELKNEISPYENINLKLFAAMRRVALESGDARQPLLIRVVNAYASLFPEEAEAIYGVLLKATRGVTASQELATAFEDAAVAGRRGDIEAFRQRSAAAFSLLKITTGRVAHGELALGANLGPELWVVNSSFKIAPAVWEHDRTLPLTLNLNTATEAELMTLPGVDLAVARRIVAERRARGYFRSLDELRAVAGVSPDVFKSLVEMSAQMEDQAGYKRQ